MVRRPQRIALLQHIAEQGSITAAAKSAGISYKAAWDAIDELNNLAQTALVQRSVGGKGGGGARLSVAGERVLRLYQRLQVLQSQVLDAEDTEDLDLLGRLMLRTSARNQLHGNVTAISSHGHNDMIELALAGGLSPVRANHPRQYPAPGTADRQPGGRPDQGRLATTSGCQTGARPGAQSSAGAH